jgi:nitrous oxidase accessory protein NosD
VVENIEAHNCTRAGIEANATVGTAYQTITIRNCVIHDTDSTSEGANVSADGITLLNCSALVQNCIIQDMVPVGLGTGTCIDAVTCTNTFFDNNFLANSDVGVKTTGAGTRYYYRNNLTAGIATPFSIVGGVDRGGNF